MSFSAIDPDTGHSHDADWFNVNRKKIGICPICDSKIELRAEHSTTTVTHFWHGTGSDCPSIKRNRKRYEDLPASSIDKEAGARLRAEVRRNLYAIYQTCSIIVDGLKYADFRSMIEKATAKGILDYKGLQLNYVPYVLLTFHDAFSSKESAPRNGKYHIVLAPAIHNLDDLWNKPQSIKQAVWKIYHDKGCIDEVRIKPNIDPIPEWFKEATKKLNF